MEYLPEDREEVKVTLSLNKFVLRIIDDEASKVWPEFGGNRSGRVRKIVERWYRARQGVPTLEEQIAALAARVAALERDR